MNITIYINGKKRHCGTIKDTTYRKTVLKSKHLFRKFDAWGFDYKVVTDVILPNATTVIIDDKEENIIYQMPAVLFGKIENGKYIPSANVEIRHYKGNRTQIFMPRRHFLRVDKNIVDNN